LFYSAACQQLPAELVARLERAAAAHHTINPTAAQP
jgi:hypothetical protein